jgi:hypothetical protein
MEYGFVSRSWLIQRASASVKSRAVRLYLFTCLSICLTSCSEEEIKSVTNRVAQVQQAVEAVSPVTDGHISLGNEPHIQVEKCWAWFCPPEDGRAGVLQLSSYSTPSAETYPAVFFRAVVQARNVGELSGKSIAGELFIQERKDGDVLSTSWENPPECMVASAGDWSVSLELKDIPLHSALDGKLTKLSGKLLGTLAHD